MYKDKFVFAEQFFFCAGWDRMDTMLAALGPPCRDCCLLIAWIWRGLLLESHEDRWKV